MLTREWSNKMSRLDSNLRDLAVWRFDDSHQVKTSTEGQSKEPQLHVNKSRLALLLRNPVAVDAVVPLPNMVACKNVQDNQSAKPLELSQGTE